MRKNSIKNTRINTEVQHELSNIIRGEIKDPRIAPMTSVVAVEDGKIVGAILCGHDGRRGCLYHVCVDPDYRRRGIGKAMVVFCMEALRKEEINKVCLIAFTKNDIGNAFWHHVGWIEREDLNYYDFVLNTENIVAFNQ